MVKLKIYTCGQFSPHGQLMVDLLELENLPYTTEMSISEVMKLTKGKVNPLNATVIVDNEGKVLTTIYDLVEWIEERGLRYI